jgi:hypothetical protein
MRRERSDRSLAMALEFGQRQKLKQKNALAVPTLA